MRAPRAPGLAAERSYPARPSAVNPDPDDRRSPEAARENDEREGSHLYGHGGNLGSEVLDAFFGLHGVPH